MVEKATLRCRYRHALSDILPIATTVLELSFNSVHNRDARILLETLLQTRDDKTAWTYQIASGSRSTRSAVMETLSRILGKEIADDIRVTHKDRLQLAIIAARASGLSEASKVLDWQEFEMFAEECLC